MSGECHECVDASPTTGVGVWDPEDVGGGVACQRIAEEYGSAGGARRRGGPA